MALPTVAWDETNPPDTRTTDPEKLRSEGEARIREFKTQIRELIALDHQMDYVFGTSQQDTDWGWHNTLTLIAQSSNPSAVADSVILYTKTVGSTVEAHFIDEDGNSQQLTSNGSWIGGIAGEIRMWNGLLANIPAGWQLCDALVAKFVRGINTSTTVPGANSGGANEITLNSANIPHAHSVSSSPVTHSMLWPAADGGGGSTGISTVAAAGSQSATLYITEHPNTPHTHTVSSYGGATAFNNRPAYYELAYIERI